MASKKFNQDRSEKRTMAFRTARDEYKEAFRVFNGKTFPDSIEYSNGWVRFVGSDTKPVRLKKLQEMTATLLERIEQRSRELVKVDPEQAFQDILAFMEKFGITSKEIAELSGISYDYFRQMKSRNISTQENVSKISTAVENYVGKFNAEHKALQDKLKMSGFFKG